MRKDEWYRLQNAVLSGTSNIVRVYGEPPQIESSIGDMPPGDVGYTMPWAVVDGILNESFLVQAEAFGTATLEVQCVGVHQYELDYRLVKEMG